MPPISSFSTRRVTTQSSKSNAGEPTATWRTSPSNSATSIGAGCCPGIQLDASTRWDTFPSNRPIATNWPTATVASRPRLDSVQHAKAKIQISHSANDSLFEKLSASSPRKACIGRTWPAAYNDLGVLLRGLGRLDEALEVHQKAMAARERLVTEFPDKVRGKGEHAESLNTSSVLSGLGTNNKALDLNQRAVEVSGSCSNCDILHNTRQ